MRERERERASLQFTKRDGATGSQSFFSIKSEMIIAKSSDRMFSQTYTHIHMHIIIANCRPSSDRAQSHQSPGSSHTDARLLRGHTPHHTSSAADLAVAARAAVCTDAIILHDTFPTGEYGYCMYVCSPGPAADRVINEFCGTD